MYPAGAVSKGRLLRSAQRSDNCIARSISASSAGKLTHSSSCMAMSEPSRRSTSIDLHAVDMRAERHRALAELAQLRQRHHLEAAGVGQHRSLPTGKFLQAAEGSDPLGARPQHQMIGVAEHDIGAGIAHLAPMHALHGASGADRHEGRRSHHAMRRGQFARARAAVGRDQIEVIGKAHTRAYGVTTASSSTSLRPISYAKAVDADQTLPHKLPLMITTD